MYFIRYVYNPAMSLQCEQLLPSLFYLSVYLHYVLASIHLYKQCDYVEIKIQICVRAQMRAAYTS